MVWEELSLLRDEGRSKEQIAKLEIIFDFYNRLPCEKLKGELLALMEKQRAMAPSEFDLRLQDFAERAKGFSFRESSSPYAR
jgi:hypothetical protein